MNRADAFETVRTRQSSAYEQQLFARVEELGFTIAVNGTEHVYPQFVAALHSSIDQTSLALRFQPDGVACIGNTPRTFYLEAKAGKTIEKTAYEQYMKLRANGNVLVVVFEKLNDRWNFIEHIRLIDGLETVGRFEPERRFPVDEDGWICPRQCRRWHRIKGQNLHASGTPYKEVDKFSLEPWNKFKQRIIERLQQETGWPVLEAMSA